MKIDFIKRKFDIKKITPGPIFVTVIFLLIASLFWVSLWRWGDLIIDTFRDFYLPAVILDGKVLYRDIYYEYGFFAPYFIALWFKVFGITIPALAALGLTVTCLVSLAIYRLSLLFISKVLSCLVVVVFLLVFAFGQYSGSGIFNFILPYSFSSTFFITFITWSLYYFIRFILYGNKISLLWWSILLALAFFARIEFSAIAWFLFCTALIIFKFVDNDYDARVIGIAFSPIVFAFLAYGVFLTATGSFYQFKHGYLDLALKTTNGYFTRSVMGVDQIAYNISIMVRSLVMQIIIFFTASFGAYIINLFEHRDKYIKIFVTIVIASLFLFAGIFVLNNYFNFFEQYNSLPIILLMGCLAAVIKIIKTENSRQWFALLILFVISLFLLLRVFFNLSPNMYGFYLIVPGLISYFIIFFKIIPDFFKKSFKDYFYICFCLILSGFFLYQSALFWHVSSQSYRAKNFIAVTDKGSFTTYNNLRTIRFWQTVSYFLSKTSEDARVVVVPEGIGINFFSNRQNPSPYLNLHPASFKIFNEDNIIKDLRSAGVDYFVLVARSTEEHGFAFFGIDYAKTLYKWILHDYELVQQYGPYPFTSREFGVAIFKRKK